MKTATPSLDTKKIIPGYYSEISGKVGSYDSELQFVPEPDAYIYIYIDNVCINYPTLEEGVTNLVVLSDANGLWTGPKLRLFPKQRIALRALAPEKENSNFTIPYIVGSSVVATQIYNYGLYYYEKTPGHNESVIYGEIADWTYDNENVFDTTVNNSLFIYKNKLFEGILPRNEIIGNVPLDSLSINNLRESTFTFLIDEQKIDFSLSNTLPDAFSQVEVITSVKKHIDLTFPTDISEDNFFVKVFKNGRRLALDSDYEVRVAISGAKYVYLYENTVIGDIFVVDYFIVANKDNFRINQVYTGNTEQFNLLDNLGPQELVLNTPSGTETFYDLQLYKNGVRMTLNVDYEASWSGPTFNILFHLHNTLQSLDPDDVIVIDFYTSIGTEDTFTYTNGEVIQPVPTRTYSLNAFNANQFYFSNIALYKNGLRKYQGGDFTYNAQLNEVTFDVNEDIMVDDIMVVDFVNTTISLDLIVNLLNKNPDFITYQIVAAKKLVAPDTYTLSISCPYTFEIIELDRTTYSLLLGTLPSLFPGKDENGLFKYYFNPITGKFKYTFSSPLKRKDHIEVCIYHKGKFEWQYLT